MGYVVLRHAGDHLGLVPDATSGRSRLHPVDGAVTAAAVFRRLALSHDRIALQTLDGRYLTVAEDEAMSFAVYADASFSSAATFEEVLWPGGEVSLRCDRLTYLSVTPSGQVSANRTVTEVSERFSMTSAPRSLRPVVAEPEPAIARVVTLPRQAGPRREDPSTRRNGGSSVGHGTD
ncbi:hypothetical protein G7072_13200 [Nocardioides sp. HDW12B]|uniref:fascin domain-containing protein n=1 Tax=Nocardioides sp. HDW12B TaxID=2714939 RepID=UPI0014098ECF|nr:hypothetical protein [Nocardioides sp. HDW12B]QIK67172.1 hypothetical protein G7072_13200 [Nocardioides sp. HDW12B]